MNPAVRNIANAVEAMAALYDVDITETQLTGIFFSVAKCMQSEDRTGMMENDVARLGIREAILQFDAEDVADIAQSIVAS